MANPPLPVRKRCSTSSVEGIFSGPSASRLALALSLALASPLALQGCAERFAKQEKGYLKADPKKEPEALQAVADVIADEWVEGPCYESKHEPEKVQKLGDGKEVTWAADCLDLCHGQELNSACQFVWGNKVSKLNGCYGTTGAAWMLGPYNRTGEEDDPDATEGMLCWVNQKMQREDLRPQQAPEVAASHAAALRDGVSDGGALRDGVTAATSLLNCPFFPDCLKAPKDKNTGEEVEGAPCRCENGVAPFKKKSTSGNTCYACKVSCEQRRGEGPCYRCGGKPHNSCGSGQLCQIESDTEAVCINVEASSFVENDVDGLAAANAEYNKTDQEASPKHTHHKTHHKHKHRWHHGARHQPRGTSGASQEDDAGAFVLFELGQRGTAKHHAKHHGRHGHRARSSSSGRIHGRLHSEFGEHDD